MINFEKKFTAKDLNNEEYKGNVIGYQTKVLINCKDNKNNIYQNLILIEDLKKITSFKLCKNFTEIKNKFYQLFENNVKVDNQNNFLRLYLDIPNDEITKIVSKVLTLSREYSEEEKMNLNINENDDEKKKKMNLKMKMKKKMKKKE